jgi:FtsH-binding integral membrane protein
MFKIVMTISIIIVATAWIAYGTWRIVTRFSENKRPKRTTRHLQQRKESFDNYIKKLQNYEKKPYKHQ